MKKWMKKQTQQLTQVQAKRQKQLQGMPVKPVAFLMTVIICLASAPVSWAAYTPGTHQTPITAYGQAFIADCQGESWLLDETERLLNARQKTIDRLELGDLDFITSIGLRDKGIQGTIPKAIGHFENQ